MNTQEKVDAVVNLFINERYDATIEHFKIASIMEERVGSQKYRQVIQRAKKDLLDSGKMIASVHGVGYRVVNPDEYSIQSAKCVVSGARRIDKGQRILANAPVKDMTQYGIQRYNAVSDRMHILQAAVYGAKAEIKMLNAKRENPLKVGL